MIHSPKEASLVDKKTDFNVSGLVVFVVGKNASVLGNSVLNALSYLGFSNRCIV
jgi:hypothetical protein